MLEQGPVIIRFLKYGSVEDIESEESAADLEVALEIVRNRYPQAVFDRCCEHEPDGGCLFCYANEADLQEDKLALSDNNARCEQPPPACGRWIGIIASADD